MSDKTTIRPLGDRVLVRYDPPPTMSAGGIHLIEDTAQRSQWATVEAVGVRVLADGSRVPLDVRPGDRVLVEHFTTPKGKRTRVGYSADGQDDAAEYLIREEQILGVEVPS